MKISNHWNKNPGKSYILTYLTNWILPFVCQTSANESLATTLFPHSLFIFNLLHAQRLYINIEFITNFLKWVGGHLVSKMTFLSKFSQIWRKSRYEITYVEICYKSIYRISIISMFINVYYLKAFLKGNVWFSEQTEFFGIEFVLLRKKSHCKCILIRNNSHHWTQSYI